MTKYKYTAVNAEGKRISGMLTANSEADLQVRLKKDELYLETVKEKSEKSSAKRIRSDRLSDFSRNIGKLVGAGVTLVKALKIVCEDETLRSKEQKIYTALLKDVRAGISLSDSMAAQGNAFPTMMINMYKSAEASGTLQETADQMSVYYDKDYRLTKKISSSMLYPKILGVMMLVVVCIILGFVVPKFEDLFATMDELPAATTILLGLGNFIKNQWYLLILGAVILFIGLKLLGAIPGVKAVVDFLKIRLPKIGKLQKIIYTARFARTLASLYNAGIPIVQCLEISKGTIGNRYIENQFPKLIKDVQAGQNLSEALSKVDGFTKKLISSVVVGEETGTLDEMLISTANQLEYESEQAVAGLVALIEPCIIVILAILVGFIIIAVITPIYGSYSSIAAG